MSTTTMRITRRMAAVAGGVLGLGLAAGTAQAAAATLTMSPLPDVAPLVQKLYVPVAVTIACDPSVDPLGSYYQGSVMIRQVVRKQVAHGSQFFSGTCDGTPHTMTLNVFPEPAYGGAPPSSPFKKGNAVISANASMWYGGTASQGPQAIRLR